MEMEKAGEWLEAALNELCSKAGSGLQLDADLISGLVSFCELAPPLDAADYLTNIIGADLGREVIQGYLQKRGHLDPTPSNIPTQPTTKPASPSSGSSSKPNTKATQKAAPPPAAKDPKSQPDVKPSSKKKKGGKAMSLAEATKASVVFQQGKPCSCQARRHALVSNCLACGKIVCAQEGEGPCSFCGALVLREGSGYAGLDLTAAPAPASEAEARAGAFAKRLLGYDRDSAARTRVIDDQSDYYEIEGNSWLSNQEKDVLRKRQKEAEEAAEAKKKNVVITFDLVGRKVVLNKDEASEQGSESSDTSILRPSEEADLNRIKPNPTVKIQPVFVQTKQGKSSAKGKENKRKNSNGLCLEITGRVQSDKFFVGREETEGSKSGFGEGREGDDFDCSHDFD